MTKIKQILTAAAFLLLGGCLLLAAGGIFSQAGVRRGRAELPGGGVTVWTPAAGSPSTELADGEDGHDHLHIIASGGGALGLTDGFDGSRSLATELARRGVTVLLCSGQNGADAWDYLRRQMGEQAALALLAGTERADEALALAGELYGSGERPAAVMLLGNESTLRTAADYPGGNILILTRTKPGTEALTAFYGSAAAAERGFDGFFGEGTARACAWNREFGSFARQETLERVADWKGSTLGHAVEIPDSDQVFRQIIFCCVGAAACLLLAVGTLTAGFRRKIHK